jgi:hypothetical protein
MVLATYQPSSVYYRTPQNSYYLGFWQPPLVASSANDQIITLAQRYRHRPDLLSNDLYGTAQLWWIFAMLNPDTLQDPVYDMVPGKTIRAPSLVAARAFIG